MRMGLRLTFLLYVMDAAHWAYRNCARAAAYGHAWVVPVWLVVMDGAYYVYVWALRKVVSAPDWKRGALMNEQDPDPWPTLYLIVIVVAILVWILIVRVSR